MKKLILHSLFVLVLAISISAQTEENKPKLIGEFGTMPLDEMRFRVGELTREVNKLPNSKALIKIYGGQEYSFTSAYVRGSLMKSIWGNFVKYPAEKLLIQFCNINKEPIRTEFFVVRENDEVEPCDENLIVPKETVLFESAYFESNDFAVPKIPFNSVENEYPSVEDTVGAYSEFALNILNSFLKDSPQRKVYIIAYLQTNFEEDKNGKIIIGKPGGSDKKSYAQKMFRAARKELLKNGFSPSQIMTIDGGYVDGNGRRLEFWFVPAGGIIPKPKPDYFPKKKAK
ncbi:MAG TPA: hypothetical protein VGC97_16415 [Pyrinomonadaceae bacterium]|jgi:hypothetical protein